MPFFVHVLVDHGHGRFSQDDSEGATTSNLLPNFFQQVGLVLHAISTSPWLRWAKVMVNRAHQCPNGTLANSLAMNSLALASLPYLRLANSQAARIVPRAAASFGVGDDHVGADQVVPVFDVLGLPSRTASTMVLV